MTAAVVAMAGDWRLWLLLVVIAGLLLLGAWLLARPAHTTTPDPDPAGDVQTMAAALATDLTAARYIPPPDDPYPYEPRHRAAGRHKGGEHR